MQESSPYSSGTETPQETSFIKLHHSVSMPEPTIVQVSTINVNKENKNTQTIKQLFNFSLLKNEKHYQKTVKQIAHLMNQFDKFTDNLELKVDNMLAAQQCQFVDSYKRHMKKVEAEYKSLQKELQQHKQLIKYYENEGKMSNLIKKVAQLEDQSKKIYAILQKKQKEVKSAHLEIKVQKEEYKRIYSQLRQATKSKNQLEIKLAQYERKSREEIKTPSIQLYETQNRTDRTLQQDLKFFTTEINDQKSLKKDMSITTADNKRIGLTYNLSEQTITLNNQQQIQKPERGATKLRTQLAHLSNKHRKLAKISSKIMQSQSELQKLFISSVAEIKKHISIKKKIKECTFEDFKKEDKINLLLTIISNEDILKYVYERIFNKQPAQSMNDRAYSYTSVMGGNLDQRQFSVATQLPRKRRQIPYKLPEI